MEEHNCHQEPSWLVVGSSGHTFREYNARRARVRVQIVTFSTLALFELRQSFHVHEIDPTDDDKRESHKVSNLQKQQNESSSIKKEGEKKI